ncbi:MAG: helix-turn-helix transcriptional regulator [Actinomycetota bacterium]
MRHRHDFHQLIVCGSGHGVHHVDFEPIEMRPRRVLHVHPGQVHEYQFDPDFDAHVVAFRAGLARATIPGHEWFPGSNVTVVWDLSADDFVPIRSAVRAIRSEQHRFDGSVASVMLMESLLAVLLARVHQHSGATTDPTALPEAYVRYREYVEQRFRERPTVASCARELGYSTRTLDRACHAAVGRSAKTVLDERIALDIDRLLKRTTVSISGIGAAFGFTDPSSFSKFVHRHLGGPPSMIRSGSARDA